MDAHNPLGKATVYPEAYSADYLFPIARNLARELLGIADDLPFTGYDRWTGYEVSWLNARGKPEMRVAEFVVAADSPNIIESKSFKLYLNSLNQSRFASEAEVLDVLQRDLSQGFGAKVSVILQDVDNTHPSFSLETSAPGELVDQLDIDIDSYTPDADLLGWDDNEQVEHQVLVSHLLKTNCPITDQPDWGSLYIEYSGKKILPESLLRYVVSFRQHQGYHENCVEQIFCDIKRVCQPEYLTVYARYTRRGGLDINPFRSNYPESTSTKDISAKSTSQLLNKILRTTRQ